MHPRAFSIHLFEAGPKYTLFDPTRPQDGASMPRASKTAQVRVVGESAGRHLVVEVVVFLKEIGLEQYALHFLRSGFDDLETLMAIEDTDMKELGIPAFHTMRLRRKLQDLGRMAGVGEHQLDSSASTTFSHVGCLWNFCGGAFRGATHHRVDLSSHGWCLMRSHLGGSPRGFNPS